jgi:hypothetical protein
MKLTLVVALSLLVACKKKQAEDKPVPVEPGSAVAGSGLGSGAEPTGSNTGASGSGSQAGSNTGSAGSSAPVTKTGFAPFDDSFTGTRAWISAEESKVGVVELDAYEDLSGKTKGTSSVKRLCGAPATEAVAKIGAAIVTRSKDGHHDTPVCTTDGTSTSCVSPGVAEGDIAVLIEYQNVGGNWNVIGIQSLGTGMVVPKLEAEYKKLLGEKCK